MAKLIAYMPNRHLTNFKLEWLQYITIGSKANINIVFLRGKRMSK